jgi:hypothetical protein
MVLSLSQDPSYFQSVEIKLLYGYKISFSLNRGYNILHIITCDFQTLISCCISYDYIIKFVTRHVQKYQKYTKIMKSILCVLNHVYFLR